MKSRNSCCCCCLFADRVYRSRKTTIISGCDWWLDIGAQLGKHGTITGLIVRIPARFLRTKINYTSLSLLTRPADVNIITWVKPFTNININKRSPTVGLRWTLSPRLLCRIVPGIGFTRGKRNNSTGDWQNDRFGCSTVNLISCSRWSNIEKWSSLDHGWIYGWRLCCGHVFVLLMI